MSTEARKEAAQIIRDELAEWDVALRIETVEAAVDKLLETHAISRRAPRVLRRVAEPPPIEVRPGQKPAAKTQL